MFSFVFTDGKFNTQYDKTGEVAHARLDNYLFDILVSLEFLFILCQTKHAHRVGSTARKEVKAWLLGYLGIEIADIPIGGLLDSQTDVHFGNLSSEWESELTMRLLDDRMCMESYA